MTAGIAATRPIAVAMSASAIFGATTGRFALCWVPNKRKRAHDAVARAKQPEERRRRADRAEERHPRFEVRHFARRRAAGDALDVRALGVVAPLATNALREANHLVVARRKDAGERRAPEAREALLREPVE